MQPSSEASVAPHHWRPLGIALILATIGVVSLLATYAAPQPNGLGVLPGERGILEQSGVTLHPPSGTAAVGAVRAVKAAIRHQTETEPIKAVLATVVGPRGSRLSPPGRLCWVVFLDPVAGTAGGQQLPGRVSLDAVLINARSGAVLEGFIAFRTKLGYAQAGSA
ncbi:MAG: hypothetical protein ACRENY_08615 [Candidatus Dormibacteria bacterium]